MIELSDPCTCDKIRKPDLTYFCPDCWRTPKGEECHKTLLNVNALDVNIPLNENGKSSDIVEPIVETRLDD
jgi:hypothetical protein